MCLKLMVVVVDKLFSLFLLKWIKMKLLLLIINEIVRLCHVVDDKLYLRYLLIVSYD